MIANILCYSIPANVGDGVEMIGDHGRKRLDATGILGIWY